MKETIKLGSEVIVTDPSYDTNTWCQAKLKDVYPGNYKVRCIKHDTGDWGVRNDKLIAIHEIFSYASLKDFFDLNWEVHPNEIGVDSGQAGIFDMADYRKDGMDIEVPTVAYDGSNFEKFDAILPVDGEGDDWYRKMCKLTLGVEGWGYFSSGVVARSGFGDGGYTLLVAKANGKIVGIMIDFQVINVENDYLDNNLEND